MDKGPETMLLVPVSGNIVFFLCIYPHMYLYDFQSASFVRTFFELFAGNGALNEKMINERALQ